MGRVEHSTTKEQINVRANRRQRDLIDHAAAILGKSRTDFILETSSQRAEEVLLDRVFFQLDDDAFEAFNAMLDNPPAPSTALRELLHNKAPWE